MGFFPKRFTWFVPLFALAVLVSCGKDVTPAAGLGGPCSRNADCASPFVCLDAKCVPTPVGCDAGKKRCNGNTVEQCDAQGLSFVTVQECAAGCSGSACLPPVCTPGNVRCNGNAIEACVPSGAEWAFVQFCASACAAGSCTPPATVCTAGATRCDGLALEQCTPDGMGWAFDQFCANACVEGACQAASPICTPGATQCDGLAVERCTPDGTAWAFERFCPYQCASGACSSPACQPFATRCQDAQTLETCAADGTQWVAAACATGQACESGVCRPTVCAPEAKRCVEKTIQTCNALGTAWDTTDSCAVGCQDGVCESAQCTPGARQCDGTAVEACAPDGSGFVFVQYCATSCADGACTPPVCAPLARRCNGKDIEVCDGAGGGWTKVDSCPDACENGACSQRVTQCNPGQLQCNGLVVQMCGADGKAFADTEECLDSCASGACVGAACTGFHLTATPSALPADGASTALVVSDLIADSTGVPVPDGTLFTVAVQGGDFASADADPLAVGYQAKSLGGRIKFTVRAPSTPGTLSITASYRLSAVCVATTTLNATTPAGERFFAEDFSSTVHRDPVATTATWDVAQEHVQALAYDPNLGVNVGNGRDGDLVVPAGSTFNLETSTRPGLTTPDVVIHKVTFIDTRYGNDFVFVDPPANGSLAPGDEVVLINMQGGACGSGNSCDPNIPAWSGYVGTYEFLTVREARPDGLIFFTTPIKNVYSDGGNADLRGQRIFLQRVPNYDHVTVEGTLTTQGWDPDNRHTGMMMFRAREGVTVAAGGVIDLNGKGYRGGKADQTAPFSEGTNVNSGNPGAVQQAGESYAGTLASYAAGSPWFGGGAGVYATCDWQGTVDGKEMAGAGGGYATAGYTLTVPNGSWPPGDSGRGSTYGEPTLSRLYVGSGAGGGYTPDTTCNQSASGNYYGGCCGGWQAYNTSLCGVSAACGGYNCDCRWYGCTAIACTITPQSGVTGGAGGGLLALWANSLDVQGTIQADGVKPSPELNGGSGGSVLVYANTAHLGDGAVHARGAYTNTYTVPAGTRPPGDGRIAVNYFDFSLTGTTDPPAWTNLLGVFRKDMAVSYEIDSIDAPSAITSVTVSPVLANTAGGDVTYSVSADGGRTWTDATPEQATAIDAGAQGADLRWRAIFRPLSTAPLTLDGLVLDYQTK